MDPTEIALMRARDLFVGAQTVAADFPSPARQRDAVGARLAYARAVLDYQAERVMLIAGRPVEELKAAIDSRHFDDTDRPTSIAALAALRQITQAGQELTRRIEGEVY